MKIQNVNKMWKIKQYNYGKLYGKCGKSKKNGQRRFDFIFLNVEKTDKLVDILYFVNLL